MLHAHALFKTLRLFTGSLIMLLALAAASSAQTTITLMWDANTESDLAGYRVEYGTQSGNPSTTIDVGNVTSRQFTGLQTGVTYYFRVRAYSTSGLVSTPSSEVTHTPQTAPPPPAPAPTLTSVSPTSGPTSGGTRITLTGSNFTTTVTVTVGGAAATSITRVSSTQVQATTPAGTAGARDVRLTNSDGQAATRSGGFTYTQAENTDTDGDGLPNAWETQYGLDPNSASGNNGGSGDPDNDGASNAAELQAGTHPRGFHRRYLAEGVVNDFFNTRLAIANAQGAQARVLLTYVDGNGRTTRQYVGVPARSRRTVDAASVRELAGASFSTTVESDELVVVDRLMSWTQARYGAHAETAVERPATTWFLAEGATHGNFELFYLLQNPSSAAAAIQVRYLRPSGAPIVKYYTVAAGSRFTIWVDQEDQGLRATDVSAEITSTNNVPIIVERSMYLNTSRRAFKGGHNSAGVTAPAMRWFLAEGSTGGFFSMYILLANANSSPAEVRATYLLSSGAPVVRTYSLAPNSRRTIDVSTQDRRLADAAMSVVVESTNGVPVIVERTMWWPGGNRQWTEGHNAFGTTVAGPRWLLAESELGGASAISSFVLVANTSAATANVRVTVLFEDAPEQSVTYNVGANQRFTVPLASAFPTAVGRRFSVLVESLNPATAGALVVERAMYWDTDEDVWGAGSNAVATRLP